jgi:hypothetical protein
LIQAKTARFRASPQSIGSFDRILRPQSGIGVAEGAKESDPGFSITGHPGNVRSIRANRSLASGSASFHVIFGRLLTLTICFQLSKYSIEPFVCHFSLLTIGKIGSGAVPASRDELPI